MEGLDVPAVPAREKLAVDIDSALKTRIRIAAIGERKSVRDYVEALLMAAVPEQKQ